MQTHKKANKTPKQTASTINCLKYFALNREASVEDVAAFIKKNYSTALRVMRKLLNARVIKFERFVRTSEEEKRGKEKRLYRITVYGLLIYFNIDKDSIANIPAIVKAHSNKILMFKKWRYFKNHGLEDEILARLKDAVVSWSVARRFEITLAAYHFEGKMPLPHNEEELEVVFNADILGLTLMDEPVKDIREAMPGKWGSLNKIWKLVNEDQELTKFKDGYLHGSLTNHKFKLKNLAEWKNYLKNLS